MANIEQLRSNFARQRSDTPRDIITHINRFQVQTPQGQNGKDDESSSGGSDEEESYKAQHFEDMSLSNRTECVAKLLEVDDFLTELLMGKASLMELLRDPEVIKELITFALGMPHIHSDNESDDMSSEDREERFHRLDRRSEVAFRTLSADFVLEVAITDEDLLDHFFSYLDSPSGKKESSHFFRTIVVFLDRYSHELMLYLRSRDGIVRKIVQNVEDQSIVDLLYKFVDAGITHQWLLDENLLKLLVDELNDSRVGSRTRRSVIAQVTSDVLHFCCRWVSNSALVTEAMENEAIAEAILHYTISPGEYQVDRMKEGLIIFSTLLQLFSTEATQEDEPPFIRLLCDNIPFFISALRIFPPDGPFPLPAPSSDSKNAPSSSSPPSPSSSTLDSQTSSSSSSSSSTVTDSQNLALLTSAGVVSPKFGTLRLQIADFFCALIYCGFPVLQAYPSQFQELFTLCIDLLFYYKWNNILHNVLTRILSASFECSSEDSIIQMFESSQLLSRLVHAFADNTPTGNKGHLLQICQEAVRASQVSPVVSEYTYNVPIWEEFVAGRLNELLAEQDPPLEDNNGDDDNFVGYDDIVNQLDEEYDDPPL